MTIIDFLKEVKRIPLWDRTPAISDENLEDLINQADMDKKIGRYDPYPILGSRPQQYNENTAEIIVRKMASEFMKG